MDYEQIDYDDVLPEYYCYTDTGCSLAVSCLNCPFPFCVHDVSPDGTSPFKKWRDQEIVRCFKKGIAAEALALTFAISRSKVFEILKAGRLSSTDSCT